MKARVGWLVITVIVWSAGAALVLHLQPSGEEKPHTIPAHRTLATAPHPGTAPRIDATALGNVLQNATPEGLPGPIEDVKAATAAVDGVLQAATPEDLPGLIEKALLSLDAAERATAFDTLLPELIASDPEAAVRLFEACTAGPACEELLHRTAQAWTSIDVDGAMQFVATLKDGDRRIAAQEVTQTIARFDTGSAIEVADRFNIGRDDGQLEHLAQLWATEDLPAALKWVTAQPPGAHRDQLLARIASVQAQVTPVEAMRLITSNVTPGARSNEAMLSVLSDWAQRDFEAAAAWTKNIPDNALRERATKALRRLSHRRDAF